MAMAQNPGCLPESLAPVKTIILQPADSSCEMAKEMARLLLDVSTQFQRSTSLTLKFGGMMDNAGFDGEDLIRIPAQITFTDHFNEIPGYRAQLDAIVVHEFGHALMLKVWQREFPEIFKKKIEDRGEYIKYLIAYDELFADVVAVFYFQNANAIFESLYFPQMKDKAYRYVKLRDFSRQHTLDEIQQFADSHTKLSLVRSFIGLHLMPQTVSQKIKYLKLVEDAIVSSAKIDIVTRSAPSDKEANERMIQFMKKELNKGTP
jgi:hypothetical protein